MNCNVTGKTLRLRLCGHAGMPSLPTRFRLFEEVLILGFSEILVSMYICGGYYGCGMDFIDLRFLCYCGNFDF